MGECRSASSLQENCLNPEVVDQIYKRNPILRHSHHPLHSPLLPLPYGDIHLPGESRPIRHQQTARAGLSGIVPVQRNNSREQDKCSNFANLLK